MKVVVNNQVFEIGVNGVDRILLLLDDDDKNNIQNMLPESHAYCLFGDDVSPDEIQKWMEIKKVELK